MIGLRLIAVRLSGLYRRSIVLRLYGPSVLSGKQTCNAKHQLPPRQISAPRAAAKASPFVPSTPVLRNEL
jgi:hypothetical protein